MVHALKEMSRGEILHSWLEDSLPFDLGSNDIIVVCGDESAEIALEAIQTRAPGFISPRIKQHRALLCVECLPSGAGGISSTVRAVITQGYKNSNDASRWEVAEKAKCFQVPDLQGFVRDEEPAILGHVLALVQDPQQREELSFAKMQGE